MASKADPEIDVEQARVPIAKQKTMSYGATTPQKLTASTQPKGEQRQDPKAHSHHDLLYSMVRHHSHHWYSRYYRHLLRFVIIVTVINYVLETDRVFQGPWYCLLYFFAFEALATAVCLFEWCVKLSSVQERKAFKHLGPAWARIYWISSFEGIVDFLSWLPLIIESVLGVHTHAAEILLLMRLIRVFKSPDLKASFRLVARVIYYNRVILYQSFLVCSLMILISSVALYYTRPEHDDQDNFSSILACGYLAILMLSGQGEPNGVMPWYTRIIISLVALFAIAQFAIPASMLTWGFEAEAEHLIKKNYKKETRRAKQLFSGKLNCESSSSSGESEREEEWKEYVEVILGDDAADVTDAADAAPEDTNKTKSQVQIGESIKSLSETNAAKLTVPEMKRAKAIFVALDDDEDGFLGWEKFQAIAGRSDWDEEKNRKKTQHFMKNAFHEVGADGKVTMHEFLIWLGNVKTSYPHYDDKVLRRLLGSMEQMISMKSGAEGRYPQVQDANAARQLSPQVRAKADIVRPPTSDAIAPSTIAGTMADVFNQTFGNSKSPQQLLDIAQHMAELENVNAALRQKAKMLEKEIRKLKSV